MKNCSAMALLAATMVVLATTVLAEDLKDPTAAPPEDVKPTGPITLTFIYTADSLVNASGGLHTGARYVDEAKVSAFYDGAVAGHDGLTALATIEHQNGARLSGELVGDSQVVSDLEGPPEAFRLTEAWLQKEIPKWGAGVKFGLIDLNSTFDVQETGALFVNSSHGIGPEIADTGLNGPSADPFTSLAITMFQRPAEGWTVQLGVFDGVPGNPAHRKRFVDVELSAHDGALMIIQVERRVGERHRFEAGAWTYTSDFNALGRFDQDGTPIRVGANAGLYALAESRILDKPGGQEGGLSGWLRLGVANGDINPVDRYGGGGLVYTGLIKGRDQDQMGVAVARAHYGVGARRVAALEGSGLEDAETTLEVTYGYALADWITLQPDVQYVIHPGGAPGVRNALVFGLRVAVTGSR